MRGSLSYQCGSGNMSVWNDVVCMGREFVSAQVQHGIEYRVMA